MYYGKTLDKCNVAELAMLAGLPKAPSRYNPFVNPKRAQARQHYVLKRMNNLGFIDDTIYQAAISQPYKIKRQQYSHAVSADYVAEIARQMMYERYQDAIYSSGMKVYTTIRKENQEAANRAVTQGIIDYELRRGFRGPEKVLSYTGDDLGNTEWLDSALDDFEQFNGLVPAIVKKSAKNPSGFMSRILVRSKSAVTGSHWSVATWR